MMLSDKLHADKIIDTCGTRCPIPLLRAKQALKSMRSGEVLKLLASDPSAKPDFDAMLRHLPHELIGYDSVVCESIADELGSEKPSRIDTFLIRKG